MPPVARIVPSSADITRVANLPRRDWRIGADELTVRVTDALRTERACACCGAQRGPHFRVPAHLGDPHSPIAPDGTRVCRLRRIPLSLYPHQAAVLVNFDWKQGALVPVGVGRGKTLAGFLIVTVSQSTRPLLVLQAGLIKKAKRNLAELSLYWKIPNWIKMISYSVLGRVSGKEELIRYAPDLLVFDEVHALKSRKAAVTKRVERYIMHHHTHKLPTAILPGHVPPLPYHGNPLPTPQDYRVAIVQDRDGTEAHEHRQCELCKLRITPRGYGRFGVRVVGMSGTITTQSPKDFCHIAHMCLPGGDAPVPSSYPELERWHYALAVLANPISRYEPGALLAFCDARENGLEPEQAARRGYARRIDETPGVVGTNDTGVKASLSISEYTPPKSAAIDEAFAMLRGDKSRCQANWDVESLRNGEPTVLGDARYRGWRLPNGWELVDGVEIYRHALELSLGFYYVWNDPPPEWWLEARRYWKKFARGIVKLGRIDSEFEVANLAHSIPCTINEMRDRDGLVSHEDPRIGNAHPYDHWVICRDHYKKDRIAIWICDSVLRDVTAWLHANPRGIVWTDQVAFGVALSQMSGRPYFQNKGLDQSGTYIDDATGSIIASLDSNKTGRDLQFKWDTNLFTCALSDGAEAQQVLARTHRDGTEADEVQAALIMGCIEHATAFETAQMRARYIEDILPGNEQQRLNFADISIEAPSVLQEQHGTGTAEFRWFKNE